MEAPLNGESTMQPAAAFSGPEEVNNNGLEADSLDIVLVGASSGALAERLERAAKALGSTEGVAAETQECAFSVELCFLPADFFQTSNGISVKPFGCGVDNRFTTGWRPHT